MYFYITLHCIGYSPSIPLSRHDSLPAQRTRRPPSDMPPGTVHPGGGLKHWDVSLLRSMQKLAKPGRVISSSIVLLTTAFAPSVWFNPEIMSNIRNVNHLKHESIFLDHLASGHKRQDPKNVVVSFFMGETLNSVGAGVRLVSESIRGIQNSTGKATDEHQVHAQLARRVRPISALSL